MVAPVAGAMKYSIQDTAVALGLMAKNLLVGYREIYSMKHWVKIGRLS